MQQSTITKRISEFLEELQSEKITYESIEYISSKMKIMSINTKDTLLNPGDICKNMYLVIDGGFVCRYIHEKTGSANTINFYLEDL
ncbi:MAG: hypothetical protein AAF696_03285, partial [Bacteroidota bacterium]